MIERAPEHWERLTLGEIVERGGGSIQTGPFGSQLHAADYVPVGIPSIMPVNIGDNRLIREGIACIRQSDAQRLSKHIVRTGDIVYSRRGDVERRSIVRQEQDGWFCGTGCLKVRFGEGVICPEFASFYLGHPEVRAWIVRHAVGATMPNLNTSIMAAIPFILPPLPEQQAIASVLGALDDKIELNRRMNKTLEDMAAAIFKAWFVDFEPVHAKANGAKSFPGMPPKVFATLPKSFIDSKLGEIPEGWEVADIESICDSITSGGTPARREQDYWLNGTIPWFKTGELHDGPLIDSKEYITETALSNSSCKLWKAGTVLFALYASPTVGRLGILTKPGTSNQAAAGLIVKEEYGLHFLVQTLLNARVKLQQIAVGAAQQNINQGVLKSHQVVIPPSQIASSYTDFVTDFYDLRALLMKESNSLAKTRDTLLPKLLSGEVRVEQLVAKVGV